ncbi:MAG: asparagine synthase (glutamine-hydrolyzing) [Gammaproteobacteria bacterium]|nr:asparagine synthase (glutamine-hydrolyzing) [Gammaproteobacteria bacterium]
MGIAHWGTVTEPRAGVERMAAALHHRGPDDRGFASFPEIELGFDRLAIVDIDGGRQPMRDRSGRFCVVFNGEITNHRALRRELESRGHVFSSDHSDTEVLLYGYHEWGSALATRLNGMFAFALWDDRDKLLYLARDRYGIKPLYISESGGGTVLFASEVKGLLASGWVRGEPDPAALFEYFNLQNNWDGATPFKGVRLFPPGHFAVVRASGLVQERFWDYGFARDQRIDLATAAEQHREILLDVIRRNVDADVPVATYLSGGIDSGAITAAAHRLDHSVRSYSCVFDLEGVGADASVDEREFSRAMAEEMQLQHTEYMLRPDAIVDALDETMHALEYPRMGISYENFLIARRVAADGRVVLSGMGGDEIHGGYIGRYTLLEPYDETIVAGRGLAGLVRRLVKRGGADPGRARAEGAARIAAMLNVPLRGGQISAALTDEFVAAAPAVDYERRILDAVDAAPGELLREKLFYLDARHYLHGLLVLEDKLSMAHSLETRVPLLDNDLVDFVGALPWELLSSDGTGKLVFRESVRPWVPDVIYRKPKMGFGPPEASWYRTHLATWLRSRLAPDRIRARGIFRPEFVQRVLDEHIAGTGNHVALIWSFLSIDSWCSVFGFYGGRL